MTTPKSNRDSIEDKIRHILFQESRGFATRPKDYDIILDEKGIDKATHQLRLLMLGEVKKELSEAHRAGNTLDYDNATDEYIDERIESEEGKDG